MSDDDLPFESALLLPRELFAVVDGGKFDDVTRSLTADGLSGLSLDLEGTDAATRSAAGYLVELPDASALRRVTALARAATALVIWSWPNGRMTLYRHLRTLNLVEIPNRQANSATDGRIETVLFRHWDPNVLDTALPFSTRRNGPVSSGPRTGSRFTPRPMERRGSFRARTVFRLHRTADCASPSSNTARSNDPESRPPMPRSSPSSRG